MLTLEEIEDSLVDMKWHQVAIKSSLSYPVVAKMARGEDGVTDATIKKISKYLIDRYVDLGAGVGDFWKEENE